jgi:lipopolysaccharide export LptBFGC system permease protein LptF
MVYKTLHWYIFRDLLRIFFLTASALTTLLAFGGMFKPFTKQGVDIRQLMVIMMNLMPAMLAYAIPIAALFAAVLVYWRISTDNELTACRAGGISFYSIVFPAFVLGVVVAAVDWGFVNYVVPKFLQATEQAVRRDAASLLVNQINRQEKFQLGNFVIYADAAREEPSNQPNVSHVILNGMAAAQLKNGKPQFLVIAKQAVATINNHPETGSSDFTCKLTDAAAFDPNNFQKATGSIDSFPPGNRPIPVPSFLKDKPKFYNRTALQDLIDNPFPFPDVAKYLTDMEDRYTFETIQTRIYDLWKTNSPDGKKPLVFTAVDAGSPIPSEYRLYAPAANLAPDHTVTFVSRPNVAPVRVEQYIKGVLQSSFTCDAVDFLIGEDQFAGGATTAKLQLHDNVMRRDVIRKIAPTPAGTIVVSGIQLPDDITDVTVPDPKHLLRESAASTSPDLRKLADNAKDQITRLLNTISSEFNSRGSFSLSCLTLVLLGAALGIELRGRNPLAVFVVGFVPAVILVLLITAGQQLAEGASKHPVAGISLIWAGNVLLLGLVVGVYSVLLRR